MFFRRKSRKDAAERVADPRIVDAHYSLGTARLQMEDYAGAIEPFLEALNLQPDYTLALADLGVAHRGAGDFDAAVAVQERLVDDFQAIRAEGLIDIDVTIGEDGPAAFIRRGDLSRERTEQRTERFAVGDKFDARVTQVDRASRKIAVSIKALEIAEEKEAVAQYGSADSGASLGDILGEALSRVQNSKPAPEPEQTEEPATAGDDAKPDKDAKKTAKAKDKAKPKDKAEPKDKKEAKAKAAAKPKAKAEPKEKPETKAKAAAKTKDKKETKAAAKQDSETQAAAPAKE